MVIVPVTSSSPTTSSPNAAATKSSMKFELGSNNDGAQSNGHEGISTSTSYIFDSPSLTTNLSPKTTVAESPSMFARLMKPLYSVLAPPHLRSCYSSENVASSSSSAIGQQKKANIKSSNSIRNFWPKVGATPTSSSSLEKHDLSSYSGGVVSLIKSSSTKTTRRPTTSSTLMRKDSAPSVTSRQAASTRIASRRFTPQRSTSVKASTTSTTSLYDAPRPWSKSSYNSQYWKPINRYSACSPSSSPSTLLRKQQNENSNDRLFAESFETFDVSPANGGQVLSTNINDDYPIVLTPTTTTSPHHTQSSIDISRTPPKFHSFLPTNEFTPLAPLSVPLTSPPWGNVKTGLVSQRVKEKSTSSLSSSISITSANRFLSKENERASIKRVTKLTKQFETGDVDQVSPLKLYQNQVYKRELEKICSRNSGSVIMKAKCFENPNSVAPRLSLTSVVGVGDSTSLSSLCTSATSSIDNRHFSSDVKTSSPICSDSGVAFSYENLFKRKPYVNATSTSVTYYDVVVQSTPDVSYGESPRQKRRFANLPSRHESFMQAVSNSPTYSWSDATNVRQTLARIPENETLMQKSADFYQPHYYTPANAVPAYYSFPAVCQPTSTSTSLDYTFSAAGTFSPTSPTSSPLSNYRLATTCDDSLSSTTRKKKAVSFSTEPVVTANQSSFNLFDKYSTNFSLPQVSDEQLQEIDRKTRRGSYIMATTTTSNVVDGVGADATTVVVGNFSPRRFSPSKRFSNVFTDSTTSTATLSYSTDYDDGDHQQRNSAIGVDDGGGSSFVSSSLYGENDTSPSFRSSKLLNSNEKERKRLSSTTPDGDANIIATAQSSSFSPTIGTNKQARMQRIINFFSGEQTWNKQINEVENQPLGVCSSSPSTSRGILNVNGGEIATSTTPMSPRNQRRSTNFGATSTTLITLKLRGDVRGFTHEGPLVHKQTMAPDGRKSTERIWKHYYAVLNDSTLYLCKERPIFNVGDEIVHLSEDVVAIDVESCIADIAYDYVKRKNVFRITTQRQSEHLLQAEDGESMLKWLEYLQKCNSLENNPHVLSSSMALIIKRYEAQSQSVSPSVKPRRPMFLKGASKDECEQPPLHQQQNSPSVLMSQMSNESNSASFSSQGEKMDNKQEKGDSTPGKARKWRKVRKSGSCPVPSPRGKDSLNPDSMFGQMLEDCPTSGENDFVPLIVQLCVKVVEHHGLTTVGVYRIPGNTAAVNSLISSLDKGFENTDFNDPRWRDVNVVSSLLKAFLRKLPDPLLTDQCYQSFIDANRLQNHSQRLKKMRELLENLPRPNYDTLKFLTLHLRKVVAHSHINKMEARNLALMFGPSLVRPSGESMATMVTHMSDQCKIIESLILYCDYIFACDNDSGDVPPGPLPIEYAKEEFVNTSFADMNDLLRRVSKTEEELEKTKDKIVKSIWKVRRGSRKSNKAVNGFIGEETQQQSDTSSPASMSNGHTIKEKMDAVVDDASRRLSFNERNIDEEIESRRRKSLEEAENASSSTSRNETVVAHPEESYSSSNAVNEFCQVAEEMRRRREEHIYTARRIFIAGTDAQVGYQGTPSTTSATSTSSSNVVDLTTAAKMDVLVQHSRHLNVNSQALDVLSPETREKIRRFQLDSQTLRYKSQRQAEELSKIENERLKIEQQCEQAKQELENDDYLDALADNPRVFYAKSTDFQQQNAVDATSITSDYSTTSSNFAGSDQQPTPTASSVVNSSSSVVVTPSRLMSQSFNGALPYSDYSSNASPITSHNTNLHRENSNHSLSVIESVDVSSPTTVVESPPSPQILYARTRLKHLDPEKSFLAKTFQPSPTLQRDDDVVVGLTPSSSVGSIPVVGGIVDTRRKSPPKVARSKTSSVLLGRRAKAWYETEDDDETSRPGVDASFVVRLKQSEVEFDQNENNVRKMSNPSSTRIVSIDEQTSTHQNGRSSTAAAADSSLPRSTTTASRISQKIKFRSKSSSADKRKDNRRHTLGNFADMEAIKTAIFGAPKHQSVPSPSSKTSTNEQPSSSIVSKNETNNRQQSNGQNNNSNHQKQSRTDKFKAWFKESFRKSSPDLIEDENLYENR